ncbi:acetylcholinesterase/butyrylcholinesterase, putative, partial [Ixodes scapularis]
LILVLSFVLGSEMTGPKSEVTGVIVWAKFGRLRGLQLHAGDHRVFAFLGVPYAQRPVGPLRFKKPVPLDANKEDKDATKLGPACVQNFYTVAYSINSEDCLHLNVWTPSVKCSDNLTGKHAKCAYRTVLVFLHGGFFPAGGQQGSHLRRRFLSAMGDVVVVIPNYRLGAFGFLNDGTESAPGNAGLHDQLLAVEWIRTHIGSFGGNGSDVVLMGHGAGAISVGFHLL